MKKIILLGIILAAVSVAGCQKDEGYDSLESLTYTAVVSDTWTESYRFISESKYEHVKTYLSEDGLWCTYVSEGERYVYDYPTLKIYSRGYEDEYCLTMKFDGRDMFKYKSQVIATNYTPWRPSSNLWETGFNQSGSVEYKTYKFYLE